MSFTEVIAAILICVGGFLMLTTALGVVRFPDFYSRLHAGGKGDTAGQGLVLVGLILIAGFDLVVVKLTLIILFVFVFNPTATHALARGAWINRLRPWTPDTTEGETQA